jgi:hypothetical protein
VTSPRRRSRWRSPSEIHDVVERIVHDGSAHEMTDAERFDLEINNDVAAQIRDRNSRTYVRRRGLETDVAKLASELVRSALYTSFKAIDHQLLAYLVHWAGNKIGQPVEHVIPRHVVYRFLDCERRDLVASLDRLADGHIAFEGRDAAGHFLNFRCNILNFCLDDASETLTYSFAIPIVAHMADPPVFALIHLEKLRRFKTGAGARLFMLLTLEMGKRLQNSNLVTFNRQQMHAVFGDFAGVVGERDAAGQFAMDFEPRPWPEFDRHVVRRAVAECNEIAPFWVRAQIKRGHHNSVEAVIFQAQAKTHDDVYKARSLTAAEIDERMDWSRRNCTPYGNLRPEKKYIAPPVVHGGSPQRDLTYKLDAHTLAEGFDMMRKAGIHGDVAEQHVRNWSDAAVKYGPTRKNFRAGTHFLNFIRRRCHVATANERVLDETLRRRMQLRPDPSPDGFEQAWSHIQNRNPTIKNPFENGPRLLPDLSVYEQELRKARKTDPDPRFRQQLADEKAAGDAILHADPYLETAAARNELWRRQRPALIEHERKMRYSDPRFRQPADDRDYLSELMGIGFLRRVAQSDADHQAESEAAMVHIP